MTKLLRRLSYLLRRDRLEGELDEELRFHVEMKQRELEADGLEAAEAAKAARRGVGNVPLTRDRVRDVWIWPWLQEAIQDLRYTARTLVHNKSFATAVVVTLTLALSLACVMVSAAVRAERSPALPEAKRLFCFYRLGLEEGRIGRFSYPEYAPFRDLGLETISVAAVGTDLWLTLHLPKHAMRGSVAVVSGNYFAVLGARPTLGRLLTADDDVAGAAPTVVLAEHGWERFFGRDPDVVGQTIRIGSFSYTIVGVASNPLAGPAYEPDVWVPISATTQLVPGADGDVLKRPTAHWLTFVGRVQPGIDSRQLEALLPVAADRLRRASRASTRSDAWRIVAKPVNRLSVGPETHEATTRLLFVLTLLTVGFLVAACSNITLLMLTRGTERARELAVRSALGATPARVVRLFAWETVMLVALAGSLALIAAPWVERFAAMPQLAGLVLTPTMDRYAVITLCGISAGVASVMVAGTVFGLDVRSRWRGLDVGHGARVTRTGRLRQVLVVVQVALTCVLLVAAGLLHQSARAVAAIPPGFVPDVLVAQLFTPPDTYRPEDGIALYERLRASLLGQRDVSAVGLAWHAPLSEAALSVSVVAPGSARPERTEIWGNTVSPGYFASLGVPVLYGRPFLDSDDRDAPPVVIVNQSFAEQWWPGRRA